jgi:hypothetical protein
MIMKNKTIANTLKISLGLFIALFFGVICQNAKASTVWTQNFESYGAGNLCTNPNWSFFNYCAVVISTSTCEDGTKCAWQEYNSGITYYSYPATASSSEGTLEIWIKLENDVTTVQSETIELKAGTYDVSLFSYAKGSGTGTTKTLTIYDHDGSYPVIFPSQGNQWLGVRIMFNLDYDRVYYGFKTPSSDWLWSENNYTLYHEDLHGNHFSSMEFSKANTNYNSFYFDNFIFTDVYSNPNYENVDIVTPDFALRDDIPDFSTVQTQTCFTNSDCTLNFNFNDLAVGNIMYLGPGDGWFGELAGALASTTIVYNPLFQGSLLIPSESTEQTKTYCVYMADVDNDKLRCGIEISWINQSTLENWMEGQTQDFCDTICDDIATTSDFLYGVQCGFESALCNLFYPSARSIVILTQDIQRLEACFPFRLVFVLPTTIENAINIASSTGANIELPMIPDIGGSNDLEFVTIASSTTMDSNFGTSTMADTRTQIGYFLYIVTVLFCVLISLFLFVL